MKADEWVRDKLKSKINDKGEILLADWIDHNKAYNKLEISVENFVNLFGDVLEDDVKNPDKFVSLKAKDPNNKLGFHKYFDAWKAEKLI